jgi:hypothetical protein
MVDRLLRKRIQIRFGTKRSTLQAVYFGRLKPTLRFADDAD